MRVVLPLLLVALLTGCRVEPRAEAPAPRVETADRPASAPPAPESVQPATEAAGDRPDVVLYVTEWCPYCTQAREYMAAENIPHRVVDIEASPQASAEYQRMGGTGGIPLVAVGTETIEGWSAEAAREMLDAAGYD